MKDIEFDVDSIISEATKICEDKSTYGLNFGVYFTPKV